MEPSVSGLIPLIKLIIETGVFSPVAPAKFTPKGRDASKDTPAFGKLGLKKYF